MRFLIRQSPLFFVLILIFSCQSTSLKPKIAIAGLAIESSTFSPAKTEASAFLARQGEKVFDYLDGMFAISIWDNHKKILFLARDTAGEKPLYYTKKMDNLFFHQKLKVFKVLFLKT